MNKTLEQASEELKQLLADSIIITTRSLKHWDFLIEVDERCGAVDLTQHSFMTYTTLEILHKIAEKYHPQHIPTISIDVKDSTIRARISLEIMFS